MRIFCILIGIPGFAQDYENVGRGTVAYMVIRNNERTEGPYDSRTRIITVSPDACRRANRFEATMLKSGNAAVSAKRGSGRSRSAILIMICTICCMGIRRTRKNGRFQADPEWIENGANRG